MNNKKIYHLALQCIKKYFTGYKVHIKKEFYKKMSGDISQIKLCVEATGVLEDQTPYIMSLRIINFLDGEGGDREVYEGRINIAGEVCELRGEDVNGALNLDVIGDDDASQAFGVMCEEIGDIFLRTILRFYAHI